MKKIYRVNMSGLKAKEELLINLPGWVLQPSW